MCVCVCVCTYVDMDLCLIKHFTLQLHRPLYNRFYQMAAFRSIAIHTSRILLYGRFFCVII